jgi:hypothetical protein
MRTSVRVNMCTSSTGDFGQHSTSHSQQIRHHKDSCVCVSLSPAVLSHLKFLFVFVVVSLLLSLLGSLFTVSSYATSRANNRSGFTSALGAVTESTIITLSFPSSLVEETVPTLSNPPSSKRAPQPFGYATVEACRNKRSVTIKTNKLTLTLTF